jgi:hypothetical protein
MPEDDLFVLAIAKWMPSTGTVHIPATVVNTFITSEKDATAISFQTLTQRK